MSQLPAPAAPRHRHDGWSPERQRAFLETLADTGSLTAAADAAGMSLSSAYRLRRHARGDEFRAVWDRALDAAAGQLRGVALHRVLNGTERRVWRGDRLRAEYAGCSDRMLIYMLEREEKAWRERVRGGITYFTPDPEAVAAANVEAARAALDEGLAALPDLAGVIPEPPPAWQFEVHDSASSDSLPAAPTDWSDWGKSPGPG